MPVLRPCSARLVSVPVVIALALTTGAGCRFLALPPTSMLGAGDADPALPASASAAAKPAPRTIPLEMVFVRHLENDRQLTDDLWDLADEQALPADVRRRLNANGLRAGVVTTRLPPELAARFTTARADPSGDPGLDPSLSETPAVVRRTLRLLPGRENEVLAASGLAQLILLERDDTDVRGGTYHDASAIFALRAWPAADGRVRLQVAPVIKHGPTERSWVGDEGVFRLETGQRRLTLDGLRLEMELPAESMLVIGCSGEAASSVGDAFCRGQGGVRLLALQPVGRTADPLFTAEERQTGETLSMGTPASH